MSLENIQCTSQATMAEDNLSLTPNKSIPAALLEETTDSTFLGFSPQASGDHHKPFSASTPNNVSTVSSVSSLDTTSSSERDIAESTEASSPAQPTSPCPIGSLHTDTPSPSQCVNNNNNKEGRATT